MRKILILRIIETVLLAAFVMTIEFSNGKFSWEYGLFRFNLSFSFALAESIKLSTTFFGFAVSLLTTLQQMKIHNQWLRASLVFSTLGIVSYSNELLRMRIGHDVQLLLTFPALLLIFDWVAYFKLKKKTSTRHAETPHPAH